MSDEVPWPVPSFTTFFISSRTYIQPTSQFNSAQSPYTNPPSIIMHICASYLFRYTLGIIFIIPVLRAYFVNLLDTQYLHQRSANDEHTFIFFFFFFPLCVCACGGSGQLTGHKSLMISSYEILNFLKMTCRPTQKVQYYKNGPEIVKLTWFSSCLTPLHINESYNSKEKSSTAFNCKFNLSQTFPTFFFAIKPNGPKFCCLKLIARVPA